MPVPRPRSAMRKIREVLRLGLGEGLSRRQVGAATGLPYTTVADHLVRARLAGLGWPLPDELDDGDLEARLFVWAETPRRRAGRCPTGRTVHRELRRKGVTLQLLWIEYRERAARRLRLHAVRRALPAPGPRHLDVVMRQEHRAGEKLFVDFAGRDHPDHRSRDRRDQPGRSCSWPSSAPHPTRTPRPLPARSCRTGSARTSTPSNSSAARRRSSSPTTCARASRGPTATSPTINRTYAELAAHYGVRDHPGSAVQAAGQGEGRSGRPGRRALDPGRPPEPDVLQPGRGERRDRRARSPGSTRGRFGSCPGSRASLFAELDAPALRPLPGAALRVRGLEERQGQHRLPRRGRPPLVQRALPAGRRAGATSGLSATTVEVFVQGPAGGEPPAQPRRVAATRPSPAHMPEAHRRHLEWSPGAARPLGRADRSCHRPPWCARSSSPGRTPSRVTGAASGSSASDAATARSASRPACARALAIGARSYRSVDSILRTGLDRAAPARGQPGPVHRPAPRERPWRPATTSDERRPIRCSPARPSTSSTRSTSAAWPARSPSSRSSPTMPPSASRSGSGCSSTGRRPSATTGASSATRRRRGCAVSATIEELDFHVPRGLDRSLVRELATAGWVAAHRNVLVVGPTGVGKTFLACALAHAALRHGHRALYAASPASLDELVLARADGRLPRLLAAWARIDVLVLDDFGLSPLTAGQAADLLEVIEDRAGRRSPSSPASSRSVIGTRRWASRRSPTRSSIGSSTPPTGSSCAATRSAAEATLARLPPRTPRSPPLHPSRSAHDATTRRARLSAAAREEVIVRG